MDVKNVTNFLGFTGSKEDIKKEKEALEQNLAPEDKDLTPQELLEKRYPTGERSVLYQWKAFSRPHLSGMNEKTMRTFIIIGIVIALLLVAMQEFFLILVVLSLIFVSYTISQTPPEEFEYQITNHGIQYGEKFYYWHQVKSFYRVSRSESPTYVINLRNEIPGKIYLAIKEEAELEKVKEQLGKYITFLTEEPKDFIEKAYESVVDRINTN